jgi:hypothetical protein
MASNGPRFRSGPSSAGRRASWKTNLRIMFNWVHCHLNGVGDADTVMTRIAVNF